MSGYEMSYPYISLSIISLHEPPPPPHFPTEAILFSTCFLCALKGSWGGGGGGSFCIERFSMNVPFDRYHTTELGRKKKRTSHLPIKAQGKHTLEHSKNCNFKFWVRNVLGWVRNVRVGIVLVQNIPVRNVRVRNVLPIYISIYHLPP